MEQTTTKYERKGQVQGAVQAIVLLIVGASVATMILIFSGSLSGQVYEKVEADIVALQENSVVNETLTPINGTAVKLNYDLVRDVTFKNITGGATVDANNYTFNWYSGEFTLTDAVDWNNTAIYASYNYGMENLSGTITRGIMSGRIFSQPSGALIIFMINGRHRFV